MKKLNDKEMTTSLNKYEKDLKARDKALDPKDPKYEDKKDVIRDQEWEIQEMRKRVKAGLPPTDWDADITAPAGYVYERQGFNARPTRVKTFKELESSKELLKGADGKNLILYRGVGSKEYADQFKGIGPDGGMHYPGKGLYGNGTYAASRNFYTSGDVAKKASTHALKTARSYATQFDFLLEDINKGKVPKQVVQERVTAMGLKKAAKVLLWKRGKDIVEGADSDWMDWIEWIQKEATKKTGLVYGSEGEAVAALGYDAYQVPGVGVGLKEEDIGGIEDYWVILNRGALVVSDDPF